MSKHTTPFYKHPYNRCPGPNPKPDVGFGLGSDPSSDGKFDGAGCGSFSRFWYFHRASARSAELFDRIPVEIFDGIFQYVFSSFNGYIRPHLFTLEPKTLPDNHYPQSIQHRRLEWLILATKDIRSVSRTFHYHAHFSMITHASIFTDNLVQWSDKGMSFSRLQQDFPFLKSIALLVPNPGDLASLTSLNLLVSQNSSFASLITSLRATSGKTMYLLHKIEPKRQRDQDYLRDTLKSWLSLRGTPSYLNGAQCLSAIRSYDLRNENYSVTGPLKDNLERGTYEQYAEENGPDSYVYHRRVLPTLVSEGFKQSEETDKEYIRLVSLSPNIEVLELDSWILQIHPAILWVPTLIGMKKLNRLEIDEKPWNLPRDRELLPPDLIGNLLHDISLETLNEEEKNIDWFRQFNKVWRDSPDHENRTMHTEARDWYEEGFGLAKLKMLKIKGLGFHGAISGENQGCVPGVISERIAESMTKLEDVEVVGYLNSWEDNPGVIAILKASRDSLKSIKYKPNYLARYITYDKKEHTHICPLIAACTHLETVDLDVIKICSALFTMCAHRFEGTVAFKEICPLHTGPYDPGESYFFRSGRFKEILDAVRETEKKELVGKWRGKGNIIRINRSFVGGYDEGSNYLGADGWTFTPINHHLNAHMNSESSTEKLNILPPVLCAYCESQIVTASDLTERNEKYLDKTAGPSATHSFEATHKMSKDRVIMMRVIDESKFLWEMTQAESAAPGSRIRRNLVIGGGIYME